MEPIRSHDGLFKFVFGEPEQMAELLRCFLPAAVAGAIDLASLRRAPDSFVDKALQGRHTDLLFTARLGRATVWLYVVPEHKSEDDRFTSWQIACYVVRIVEQWRNEHPGARELPAVLPFVLYHGERPWRSPTSPRELVDLRGCGVEAAQFLAPRQMHLPFVLLDLALVDEERIEAMRVSAITGLTLRFLQFLRRCSPKQAATRLLRWQQLITRLLGTTRGRDVLSALFSWFLARTPANHATLRTVMTKIHEENRPMRSLLDLVLELGEERGPREAERPCRMERVRAMLENQLRARFGDVPQHLQERIAAADEASLQQWGLRVLTAANADEVFAAP